MRVIYDALFARITGRHEELLSPPPPTVGALVEHLSAKYGRQFREALCEPDTGRLRGEVSLLVNGERSEMERLLGGEDEVALLLPMAGG